MKVVELINKLNEIGYDENTELTFGFTDAILENGTMLHLMRSAMVLI